MQTAANMRLFLTGISSFKDSAGSQNATGYRRFYQQIVSKLTKSAFTTEILEQTGNRLASLADQAYALRDMNGVNQASQLLLDLPLPRQYESIGKYYRALCIRRQEQGAEARVLLEQVEVEAPLHYKARAIMSVGAISFDEGDYKSALPLYAEAFRTATKEKEHEAFTMIGAWRQLAIFKSIYGDHRGALDDLEKLFPIVRAASSEYPHLYYDYMNSLAVELGEAGRLEEARNASRIALASGFAGAYPEWRETAEELYMKGRRPSRSVVAFSANAGKKVLDNATVLPLPVQQSRDNADSTETRSDRLQRPAPVLDFQLWKKRMRNEPDKKPAKEMSTREMLLRIMELISEKSITDDQLSKMLEAVENIASGSKGESEK